jgi:cysteine desulfurase
MTRVYLDHAATTPLRPEVFEAMRPWLTGEATTQGTQQTQQTQRQTQRDGSFAPATLAAANANTLYQEGKRARQALDEARATIARIIGASPTEVVFTSGGTESNNALIAGITRAIRERKGRERGGNHLVSSAFEHHAVLEPVQALKRDGYEVTLVKPSRGGFISPDAFAQALRPSTLLASVMTAQNEIGTVQPIAELARIAHANGTLLHTDAVQALGKLPFDTGTLGIDAASFSAHKLGGPQGVGAFFLKSQVPFTATQLGGGQEGKRRSGTQNIAGAVGFAAALEYAEEERQQEAARLAALRDYLAAALLALDSRIALTVPLDPASAPGTAAAATSAPVPPSAPATPTPTHLPGLLSFTVAGLESEALILRLDAAGFAVSGGSACSTGSLEPSHVLTSLGLPRDRAYGVLRVSLGHGTTTEQLDAFIASLAHALH